MRILPFLRFISGFAVLFGLYHGAEYFIIAYNNALEFLALSLLFIVAAYFIAKLQFKKGLASWYLRCTRTTLLFGIAGLLMGLAVYGIAFMTQLAFGVEVIESFLPPPQLIKAGALLVFGSFISSITEDLLTRAYVVRHLYNKMAFFPLVIVSAAIYTLNHIYRLGDPLFLLFIFLTGVHLVIPVLLLRNIWYTVGLHWAGNIIYHVTSTILQSHSGASGVSGLWLMIPFMLLLIPVNFYCCRLLALPAPAMHNSTLSGIYPPQTVIHPD